MASDQRLSFSASSNTSRSSTDRGRPSSSSSYKLPPLPPSTTSLTSGTSIPAPAPISPNFAALPPVPPPKDPPMGHPITPKRKPLERQKSPLSHEAYFSSPASIMPGAFPTTPPTSSPSQNTEYNTPATGPYYTPSPTSKSPKRPSSVRNFLSFKALRRNHDNTSLHSQNDRPASSGVESMTSSLRPSLNKKKSGTFWRRKSSLGMRFGEDNSATPTSPLKKGESVTEEERPLTPAPEDDLQGVQKRKSGTFWRRKSSLTLDNVFAGTNGKENQPQTAGFNNGSIKATDRMDEGQNGMINGKHQGDEDVTVEDVDEKNPLPEFEESFSPRSYSPPPQLPAFVGGGGGLGGEDLFKHIN